MDGTHAWLAEGFKPGLTNCHVQFEIGCIAIITRAMCDREKLL
jgi:hypothetical protein